MNVERKAETLARMMSQENLTVTFRDDVTAAFNPKTRTLILPNFVKEAPEFVRYGFNAHEIAHALYTPSTDDKITSTLNILEDIRIEKLIKRKYKGSAEYMKEMYVYMWGKQFFQCDEVSIQTKHFVDRLNVYSKMKDSMNIPVVFSKEEQVFVDRSFLTSTFDDVLLLDQQIKNFLKENEDQNEQSNDSDANNEESDHQQNTNDDEQDSDHQQNTDNEHGDSTDIEQESEEEESNEDSLGGAGVSYEEQGEFESETQAAADKAFSDMVKDKDEDSKEDYLIGQPESHRIFKDNVGEKIDKWIDNRIYQRNGQEIDNQFKAFRAKNKNKISYMKKQFEMKKSAAIANGAKSSNSGELDVDMLSEYKFTEDLFLREITLPEGKNHGLVLSIDFSGSMSKDIEGVCRQAALMAMFAKSSGIALKVYGFSSRKDMPFGKHDTKKVKFSGHIEMNPSTDDILFELIDTDSCSNREFEQAVGRILTVSIWFDRVACGTPLISTTILLAGEISKWKAEKNIEKVITIFLTDGYSGFPHFNIGDGMNLRRNEVIDTITKKRYDTLDEEIAYDIYKTRTGSKVCVIYIGGRKITSYKISRSGLQESWKYFDELKTKGSIVVPLMTKTVDRYYIINNDDKMAVADNITIKEGKAAKASFVKKARAQKDSKVFITMFMEFFS